MKTGNFPLAFEVFGRLKVTGTRGIGFRTDPAIRFDPGSVFTRVVVASVSENKKKMAGLGPEGAVFYKSVLRVESGLPRDELINLGGRLCGRLEASLSVRRGPR
jgi:hypothetical protein